MHWLWTVLSVAIVNYGLVALAVISVLRRPREPRAMLAWVLALVLLPGLGLILYVMFGEPRMALTRHRRERRRRQLAPALLPRSASVRRTHAPQEQARLDPGLRDLVELATRIGRFAPTHGNEVTVYTDAEKTFLALQLAIEGARSHIHMEYFIFQPDATGRAVRDLLVEKRRAGVECRLLLDYIGCWWWPRKFVRSLTDEGVEVAFFLPVVPWRGRWRVNFRNHRKLVVVDGEVGFTGSQNIGDEYLGRLERYGPWRDTHLRVIGPAVHQLQEIFVEDWHFATGSDLVADRYFPPPEACGERIVQVIPSGPDDPAQVMHHLLFAAISAARRSVCIATPYFVPDNAMVLALQSAAYRGVPVQLLIPSRSNHRIALWAGRSFYPELCSAGVEVYEYRGGMLHSKVVVVDQSWAMVGSANMDQRSFRINFEVTTFLFDAPLARGLQDDFDTLRADADRIGESGRRRDTLRESLVTGAARLASPLL